MVLSINENNSSFWNPEEIIKWRNKDTDKEIVHVCVDGKLKKLDIPSDQGEPIYLSVSEDFTIKIPSIVRTFWSFS